MDTKKQPEALRIADDLHHSITRYGDEDAFTFAAYEAEQCVRALHAENETLRAGYDAARLEIESLQKAATDRHALQATGAHPAPCARYCEAVAFNIERRNLHAENERLRTCNKDAQHEIANLQERVQELGQMARDVNSRRIVELEAQLAAIGAGGVEPLRKRCLHQVSEPAKAGWCDGCSPDNYGGRVNSAAPAQAGGLSEQDSGLLEQAASMLDALANDERNRGNYSTAEGAACSAHAVRRLASTLLSADRAARGAAQSAPVDAALIEFIEKCGEVCFQRVREGFKGPMRWDIEFIVPGGDREVRGKTLSDAITKAIAARAAQGGA